MIFIGAQTRCPRHSGCTVNINRTRDNIRSKVWWEARMGAQTTVLVVWELALHLVSKRNP